MPQVNLYRKANAMCVYVYVFIYFHLFDAQTYKMCVSVLFDRLLMIHM